MAPTSETYVSKIIFGSTFFAALVFLAPGCSPTTLKLTSLDPFNIDPPRADVVEIHPDEAVWWQDDKQRIHLAMQWQTGPAAKLPLFGTGEQKFILVYRSEQPFNGLAANLRVEPKSLRMVLNAPGQENYFSSSFGVVSVKRKGDQLTGSLRAWVGQQNYDFLMSGWTRPAPYLIMGQFSARQDATKGHKLVNELGGEPPPPATQPASQPASQPGTRPASQPVTQPATQPSKMDFA